MTLIPLIVPDFVEAEPSLERYTLSWTTTFHVDKHLYNLRVEAAPLQHGYGFTDLGVDGINDVGPDTTVHVVKFDNVINEVDAKSNYKRLPADMRLDTAQMLQLGRYLAGAVVKFVNDYEPKVLIGLPNDQRLERWYEWLVKRGALEGHLMTMCQSTYYDPYKILLIRRQ